MEELTEYIDTPSNEPTFTDISAHLSIDLSENRKLTFGYLYSDEDTQFSNEEESAVSTQDSNYLWLKIDSQLSDVLQSSFALSHSILEKYKRGDVFEIDFSKWGYTEYNRDLEETSIRNVNLLSLGKNLLEFGGEASYSSAIHDAETDFYNHTAMAEFLGTQEVIRNDAVNIHGLSGGLFVGAEIPLSKLTFHPSIRWDIQDYYESKSHQQLSPRLGIRYESSEQTEYRLNLGRFHQPEEIFELPVADGRTTFSSPQSNDYIALGADWLLGQLDISAEIFHKKYRNPKPRYESYFNPFVLLPELEPDRIEILPSRARAFGLDFEMLYEINEELTGSLGYSYLEVEDQINEVWIPRRWSQDNTVNGQLIWERESYAFTAAFTWHSGWKSSSPSETLVTGTKLSTEELLNNISLKDYFSFDITARKTWNLNHSILTARIDVINATNRRNSAGVDFDIVEDNGVLTFLPEGEVLLPITTTVSIELSF